jgi:hypothetical protein
VSSILFLMVVGTTIWVGVDANNLGVRRGRLGGGGLDMSIASWVICCLLLWIVAFPCYLIARGRYTSMSSTPSPWQNAAAHQGMATGYAQPGASYGQNPMYAGQPMASNAWGQPVQFQPAQAQPAQAPPQFSPDGRWWWNGQQWLAAQPAPPVHPPS